MVEKEEVLSEMEKMSRERFQRLCINLLESIGFEITSARSFGGDMEAEGEMHRDGRIDDYVIRITRSRGDPSKEINGLESALGPGVKGFYLTTLDTSDIQKREKIEIVGGNEFFELLKEYDMVPSIEIEGETESRTLASATEQDRLMRWGDEFKDKGDYKKALEYYSKAIKNKPEDIKARSKKAEALLESGQILDAIDLLDDTIISISETPKLWYLLGRAYHEIGKYDEEINAYETALDFNEDHVPSWKNLGAVLFERDEYDEAMLCFDRILEVEPKDEVAWNNKGLCLMKKGELKEALNCINSALSIYPDFEDALINKILIFEKEGRISKAIQVADKLTDLHPKNESYHYIKGAFLEKGGYKEEALKSIEKALELKPNYEAALKLKNRIKGEEKVEEIEEEGPEQRRIREEVEEKEEDIHKAEEEKDEVKDRLDRTEKELEEVKSKKNELEEKVKEIESQVEKEKGDVPKRLEEKREEIERLQKEKEELKQSVKKSRKIIDELKETKQEMEEELERLKKEKEEEVIWKENKARKEVEEKEQKIDELKGEKKELLNELDKLKNEKKTKEEIMEGMAQVRKEEERLKEMITYNEAELMWKMGEYKEVIESLNDTDAIEFLNLLGACYYREGNTEKAEDLFRKADDSLFGKLNLEEVYYQNEQYRNSIKVSEDIVDGKDKNCVYWERRGESLRRGGKIGEAVLAYLKAEECTKGELTDFIMAEARCNAGSERVEKGIETLEKVSDENKNEDIYNLLGIFRYKNREFQDSIKHFRKAVKIENALFYNNLGCAAYKLGRYGEALSSFETAINLEPDHDIYLNNLGYTQLQRNLTDSSYDNLTRAWELFEEDPVTLYNLALVKKKKGEEDWKEMVKKALKSNPEFEDAKKLI
ncbi:MAG: tetratricopeptide repeat protein [Candidatus Saliniplasma sp.]